MNKLFLLITMILFMVSAYGQSDIRSVALKYCKAQESTYFKRMACFQYMFDCAYELETNNVLYNQNNDIRLCKKSWASK